MRKFSVILMVTFLSINGFTQNNQDYIMFMTRQIKTLSMTKTIEGLQALADDFERTANAQTDKWHPLYYAAFCHVNMSFKSEAGEIKDQHLDQAQALLDRALEIYPDESELMVLQGLLYQGRIQVDPKSRGRNYSGKAKKALEMAIEYNPDNPRAYYLLGLNVLHTPEGLGGGAAAACPYFEQGNENYKNQVPDHVLDPSWGAEENYNQSIINCQDSE
ncbi:MAG: hypothetical protein R2764_08545 [Bacteroidales bacterium]